MKPQCSQCDSSGSTSPTGPDRIDDVRVGGAPPGDEEITDLVSEMAAGAAHEINNPLAVISGRAQLMAEKSDNEEDRRVWDLIADQAQKISDIVSDLMRLASNDPPKTAMAAPEELLKTAIDEFSGINYLNPQPPRFDKRVDGHLPEVRVDRAQIGLALRELITNAMDARPDGLEILLSARALPDTKHVLLTVGDNGPGMDAKTLRRAFTPFFSAQAAGRKRGLGLPMARRYVSRNGGRLWLESRPDEGTTAYLLLPAAESDR